MRTEEEIKKEVNRESNKVPAYTSSRELQVIQIELLLDIRQLLQEPKEQEDE